MSGSKRGSRAVVAILVVLATSAAGMRGTVAEAEHAPGAPTDLRVNEAAAPLWVTGEPTFGWIPNDPDRGEVQTAYRIVVELSARGPGNPGHYALAV